MIEVQNLAKRYGTFNAVNDVSFSVAPDQVLGFLGPNGAGKTTVMKILTGYHFPSAGQAFVDGISVQEDPVSVKRLIGYLPESVPLYGDLSVEEYLLFIAGVRGVDKAKRPAALNTALDACGLGDMRTRRIETLSKGYKQRTGLAQAIIHDPPVLILDEPTTGLDPNQIIEIRGLIKELGKSKTVILSTHILQEVEAVCTRVLILNEGRIAAQGSPEEIAATMKGGETWTLTVKGGGSESLPNSLAALFGLSSVKAEADAAEGLVTLSFFLPALAATTASSVSSGERIFDWAVTTGVKIVQMNRKKLSLEDIFVRLTTNQEAV
jgi:ABC-2 type transport system ATP-binding protein